MKNKTDKNKSGNRTSFSVDKKELTVDIGRAFDASRELVWKAMSDSTCIPQWWGPARLTTKVDKQDLKVDGEWRFFQRDQDGKEFGFHGVYKEVMPPERLVFTFNYEGMPAGHESIHMVELKERGGTTFLTIAVSYRTIEDLDGMIAEGMQFGMEEGMDRLDVLLKKIVNE